MTTACKILTAQQWAEFERERVFRGAPVDVADGYIHLSTADQLDGTLARHFAGQGDLRIAEVDLTPLGDAVRWEKERGEALFPHIYGELQMHAVAGLSKRDCREIRRFRDSRCRPHPNERKRGVRGRGG